MSIRVFAGDAREVLRSLPEQSVQCCVTSPPYFGLRSYLPDGHPSKALEMGLEQTPEEYVAGMVEVFREVRRVLRDDGVLFLNLGDSYCNTDKWGGGGNVGKNTVADDGTVPSWAVRKKRPSMPGIKPKDLIGIPYMVAFALRADGWYWRQRMPWVKVNPMPESTRDRPTSAVEEVFLFSKSPRYFYDYDAVKRKMAPSSGPRLAQNIDAQTGSARANGGTKTNGPMKAVRGDKQRGHSRRHAGFNDRWDKMEREEQRGERAFRNSDLFFMSIDAPHGVIGNEDEIMALDVATHPFSGAHFATFPAKLIEPLVLAGCPRGGVVLDPFFGAGTTGLVADRLGRDCIGIELFDKNVAMATDRIRADSPILASVEVER